jgi:hypothetical protein
MKKFILGIVMVLSLTACSCKPSEHTLKENVLTVVGEEVFCSKEPDTDISIYTLQYSNTVLRGCGSQTSTVQLIGNKDAFEVGDKLQIVKIEK